MSDHNDFKTRLKIAKNKLKNSSKIRDNNQNGSFIGSAFKLGTELVSAVLVGTIIGFILDTWFGTKPWLIIVFFFLGSAAGILNVIKTAKKMQEKD
jgi:ATP synthase protein I|tara:strand:+ start:3146 stop:3433 length:288 start_codon:yes stop_codon:yes gene_type:complete